MDRGSGAKPQGGDSREKQQYEPGWQVGGKRSVLIQIEPGAPPSHAHDPAHHGLIARETTPPPQPGAATGPPLCDHASTRRHLFPSYAHHHQPGLSAYFPANKITPIFTRTHPFTAGLCHPTSCRMGTTPFPSARPLPISSPLCGTSSLPGALALAVRSCC